MANSWKDFIEGLRVRVQEKPSFRWMIFLLPIFTVVAAVTGSSPLVWRVILVALALIYGLVAWQVLRKR